MSNFAYWYQTEEIIQNIAINVVKKGVQPFTWLRTDFNDYHADQIFVLDKSEIVERGTHDELLQLRAICRNGGSSKG